MATYFINPFQFSRPYSQILINTYGATEVWPLVDIASGTTITAKVDSARNGTLSGWDLQNAAGPVPGTLAPFSDGTNDYGDIFTASLASAWSTSYFSFLIWLKFNSAAWTDGAVRSILEINTNVIQIRKTATNNQLRFRWFSNRNIDFTSAGGDTNWLMFSGTADTVANSSVAYINGVSAGTQTTLSTIASLTSAFLGAFSAVPATPFHGHMAYAAVKFGTPVWTATDMANMHAAAAAAAGG